MVDVKYVNVVGMKVKDLLSVSGGNLYRYASLVRSMKLKLMLEDVNVVSKV